VILQILADGLVTGSIIALGAVGLTLTYAILGFANFAHGELLTWGAYVTLAALTAVLAVAGPETAPLGPFSFGWPLLAAMAAACAACAGLALLTDRLVFARLARGSGAITLVIASFGVALALRNLLFFQAGGNPAYYSREIQIAVQLVPREVLGGLRVTPDQMLVLAVTLALAGLLHLLLTRTMAGRAMRAVARNPALARIVGLDTAAVVRWTWVLGAALAAIAGALAGLTTQLRPTMGQDLLLPLFAAAILGGIGSVQGAVLGGLVVGLAESAAVPLVGAEYRAAVAFLVLILILLARPTGILGERP
jgi:branched-chain amino acid transport system permease protein